jgi:hypothetical protein
MMKKNILKSGLMLFSVVFWLISPFALSVNAAINFTYKRLAVGTGWAYGSDQRWHLVPTGEKYDFSRDENVQFFAQVGPIQTAHQWRLTLYRGNDKYREITESRYYPNPNEGWNFSNFTPEATQLPTGDYRADFYLENGNGFENLGSVSFRVTDSQATYNFANLYTFDHAVTASDWQYGYGSGAEHYNIRPVNQRASFNQGETVYLLTQTRNVSSSHRYQAELYRDDTKLWTQTGDWNYVGSGWPYSNYITYNSMSQYGSYRFRVYIDFGSGWNLLASVPFTVSSNGSTSYSNNNSYYYSNDFSYDRTITATGWRYGSGSDYWQIQPVNEKSIFNIGDTVYAIARARNIRVGHQWKIDLYRDGRFVSQHLSGWTNVSGSLQYGNFYPYHSNAQAGSYEWRVYLDTGNGYKLMETKPFSVRNQQGSYTYMGARVAENWTYGTNSDYWNIQPVNPGVTFKRGSNVFVVAQARDVRINHRWKVETLKDGKALWSYTTPWNDVGAGGWTYSNFYPGNYNSGKGKYIFKIYFDDGSGFKLKDTKNFSVS